MTECERIVNKGVINEAFLQEETRCGYVVSSKMKKVWAIEIDLLSKLSEICEENGLRFWVGFGTLLGAVRHQGFIPWDDDLDVWMPREDYNKLLSLEIDLEKPYFLQTTLNDDDYYSSFARLRNSNTTGILVSKNNNCNNGIYIDIYPLDAADNSFRQRLESLFIYANNICAHAYAFNINPNPVAKGIHWWLNRPFISYDLKKTYQRINRVAQRKEWVNAEKVGIMVFNPYKYEKCLYDKNDFADTVMVDFENIEVPVPSGFNNILKVLYGNYMEYPPVEKRGNWHSFIFEPDISYKEFKKK